MMVLKNIFSFFRKSSLVAITLVVFIILVSVLTGSFVTHKDYSTQTVKWMTIEEALMRSKTEPRKIFFDVYTDWCGWCKRMDQHTFNEVHVAQLLNEKFYPVKFDAEQLNDVLFKTKTYRFVPYGRKGYHQFAAMLLNNKMGYPTVVFMDEDLSGIYPVPGYRAPQEFYTLLMFFSNNHYKEGKNAWEEFRQDYEPPF